MSAHSLRDRIIVHRLVRLAGAVVCALACAWASPAVAAVWTAPVPGCSIIAAYGSTYSGCVHRGVDLAACPGEVVSSPVSGAVVFAGRVPADGGGTCNAVTIELSSGERVSLLPLDELWVSEGTQVAASEQLGSLAASGDDSSARSHLHLSYRRDGVYLDPTALLPGAATGSEAADGQEAELPPVADTEPIAATPEAGSAIVAPAQATSGANAAASDTPAVATSVSLATAGAPSVVRQGEVQQSAAVEGDLVRGAASAAAAGGAVSAAAGPISNAGASSRLMEAAGVPAASALAPPRITAGSVPGVLASLSTGAFAVSTTSSLPALLGGVCIAALSAVALRRRLSAVES